LRTKHGFAALIIALALATPVAAQQYGAPQPQQPQSQQAAPDLSGTWTGQSQGPAGSTTTTYGFGQDGTFAQAQQSQNGEESRFWGTYTANPVGPGAMQLDLQITGFLPQVVCVQIQGFPTHCNPQSGPSQMSGTIQFTSPSSVEIGGEVFNRDPNPTLLNMQVPQQLVLNGTQPTAPNIPQPVVPNIPQPVDPNAGLASGGAGGSGSNCDDLQQERLCAINNGHYERSGGCLICVPP
jgi:hypothetical protein